MKGKFITFEGSEGAGKSTQINLIRKYLTKKKKNVLFVREPGSVKISEKIRRILLDVNNGSMTDECEMLLYMASRAQLVNEVILPALTQGKIILCDRFLDSTVAYQGYGLGVDKKIIKQVGKFATQGVAPDLTIVFDLDAKKGLSRIKRSKDRIEQKAITYHNRVRQGYLSIAKQEPKRVKVIKVDKSIEQIHQEICIYVDRIIKS